MAVERQESSKDEFVSLVSHELRGPLTAAKGFVQLLTDRVAGELNERQTQYLEVVARNIERVLSLIDDLRVVSASESGTLDILTSEQSYLDVINKVVATTTPVAEEKSVDFKTEIEPDLPPIKMDGPRIEHALAHLISNAITFTQSGGEVVFRVSRSEDGIATEITDTGIGIPEAEQARVFEPFFRASTSAKAGGHGSGLGLAIAKAIVERHGGRIWFESSLDKGSTFAFWLPLRSGD